jgi:lactoylglutathione lyase/glyoxylase I family protein
MAVRSFHHIGLSVADHDRQCRFYSRAFGFREEYRTEIPEAGIRISLLSGPGGALELTEYTGSAPQHFTDPADGARTQGYFHWALTVSDLEDAITTAVAHGARVISEPRPSRRGDARFAYLADPEHNLIELLQPTR